MQGSMTVFTTEKPEFLGKTYSLDLDGTLLKTVAGNLSEGRCEVVDFENKADFAALLMSVDRTQAISSSVPRNGVRRAAIRTDRNKSDGTLARTKADFGLAAARGVLILDYDPPKKEAPLTRDELRAVLEKLCPEASLAGVVYWCSGSSHIYNADQELQGLRGQRLYVFIEDTSDVERAGALLAQRCWLNGYGRIDISNSGSLLERSVWDESMHQPARLDFIGGAVCIGSLNQRRGEPELFGGDGWLNTRLSLPDLTEAELAKVKRLKQAAKDASSEAAHTVRAAWARTRVKVEAERLQKDYGVPEDKAVAQSRRMLDAALNGTLQGSFGITLPDGRVISVAEVLDAWQQWDRVKTLDPLEPEHRNGEACGILYLSGPVPRLYSFAHGGMTFRLVRQPIRVVYSAGRHSVIADKMAQALSSQGDIFFSGGNELVQALPGRFAVLDRPAIQYQLGHRISLVQIKDGADVPINIPLELVSLTTAALGQKPEQTPPTLVSVTSLPYATTARRIMTQAGYCADSRIFNIMTNETLVVPSKPTRLECIEAVQTLMKPFSRYKWALPADLSGIIAAVFTTVLRPAMEIAPGVFFDAPVQGSGKTKAALALGVLSTGDYVGVTPFVLGRNQEEEYSKAIVALLRSDKRVWIIDNVVGRFESAALASLITSGKVQGRILGASREGDFSGRLMLCATGNNATLGNDLSRRFLCCRIDAGVERPSDVHHSFDPAQVAKDERIAIAVAVLTLLAGYWASNRPAKIVGGSDFPEWSQLVREPIVWIHEEGIAVAAGLGEICDPARAMGGYSTVLDAAADGHRLLLEGLKQKCGLNTSFTASAAFQLYVSGSMMPANSAQKMIREGIDAMTGGQPQTARSLGLMFGNRRDRRIAGLRINYAGKNRDGALWQICAD